MDALRNETRYVGEIFVEIDCSKFIQRCIRQQLDVFQNDILNGEGVDVRKSVLSEVNSAHYAPVRGSIAQNVAHFCVRNRKEGFIARFSSDAFCELNDYNEICFWCWIENVASRNVGDVDEAEIINFRFERDKGMRS